MNKFVLLTVLLAYSAYSSAQDYSFKVLANKGNNEIKSGENWQPLKTGASLKQGDELKLGDNSYIGLVHNTGKPIELKESGVHKVTELENRVPKGGSVLNKYTDFILSSNNDDSKQNRMTATGAVHRGEGDKTAIHLYLPVNEFSGIFNDHAVINWDGGSAQGPYIVTVKNMFEDVLTKVETQDTKLELDLSEAKYAQENAVLVEVHSKSNASVSSQQCLIKKLSPAEEEKVSAGLKEVIIDVKDETPLNKLILASFYENHNLLIDAIYAYEQAIQLAPDVPTFKESYEEFLVRNRIK